LGFATGVLYVWLVTRESIWSWPVGVLNALLYIVVFGRAGLYSDTGLQGVYLVLCVYGWWYWWHGGASNVPTAVTRTARHQVVWLAAVGVSLWVAMALITARIPGAALPWFDSALVATSLVAQYMTARKLLEHWLLWIVADTLYIGLFLSRGLTLTALLYTLFLGLAVHGYRQWQRSVLRRAAETP
jgi:nicotinamide mononucleotide transporter